MFKSNTPDADIVLAGCSLDHVVRTSDSGKKSGGGLFIPINTAWCRNTHTSDELTVLHRFGILNVIDVGVATVILLFLQ